MEQRATWTDERLDDLTNRVDAGFAQVDRGFERVDRGFERVDRNFERVDRDIRDLRILIEGLRETMLRFGGGMFLGFVSVIAAILARGA